MRNLPEERLKRRQSDKRKETSQRITLWVIVALGLSYGCIELGKSII